MRVLWELAWAMLWLTSDQHYGHKNIIKYCGRPFRDVDEMNEELVRRHNSVVCEFDTVLHLGDFALDHRLVQPFLSRLRGTHILVAGNHDACFQGRKAWRKFERLYQEWGFARVRQGLVDYLGGTWLSHMPTDVPAGNILLHGHVHEKWRVRGNQVNVGVDQWDYTPVEFTRAAGMV